MVHISGMLWYWLVRSRVTVEAAASSDHVAQIWTGSCITSDLPSDIGLYCLKSRYSLMENTRGHAEEMTESLQINLDWFHSEWDECGGREYSLFCTQRYPEAGHCKRFRIDFVKTGLQLNSMILIRSLKKNNWNENKIYKFNWLKLTPK